MKKQWSIIIFCCLVGIMGCTAQSEKVDPHTEPVIVEVEETIPPMIATMSLEEKVGQLFIVRPNALHITTSNQEAIVIDHFTQEIKESIETYPVGGIAFFSENITSPKALRTFTSDFQENSKIPLFIAVDEEGGKVARLANTSGFNLPKYKSMEAIGETNRPEAAYDVGNSIGQYLKEYGFNLNFAPIADINTNPDNMVIASRAFGSDPSLVAAMVQAQIAGTHDAGILATLKHFPGHGDTKEDSHKGYVVVNKTWDELMQGELIPFVANLDQTDLIMVAHIITPNITSDGLPASLSGEMVQDKLRKVLGYDGVIITDALEMGAITNQYDSGEAAVRAILAGVDILLMPEDLGNAFDAVIVAVQDGVISMERLDESVERILGLKETL